MSLPHSHLPSSAPPAVTERGAKPWFREPWFWLLFTPPTVAVVAGVITMAIAIDTFDGVVSDDYYRQGLAINQSIERDARARDLALTAQVQFNPSGDQVRVTLTGPIQADQPLMLRLVRAARSGDDQDIPLSRIAPGLYAGRLATPISGRWHLQLEDGERQWRIAATAQLPEERAIGLGPTL